MKERMINKIQIGDITISRENPVYIAGPCAVENEEQIYAIARFVTKCGANFLRGGAFKPRTSPYSFQGLGEKGLEILFKAARECNVPVVTEVLDKDQIKLVIKAAGGHPFIFQIGSRNAQNYSLLTEVGKSGYPVLLKRGKGTAVEEMVGASEYVTKEGSPVIMCERGISTFSSASGCGRNTADHIAVLKFQEAGFLTIFDPSHAAGSADYVIPLAFSGVAIGANGLIVEVHNDPKEALCDGKQALSFGQFEGLMDSAKRIEKILNVALNPAF